MSFPPCAAYTIDSLYPWRIAFVLVGLGVTVIALAEFIVTLRRRNSDVPVVAPSAAAFLTCAVVGWRSYPYWVAGVYQVQTGAAPWVDLDPKGLVPMAWIGELWRLPVLMIYLLSYVGIPVLCVAAFLSPYRRHFAAAASIAVCIGLTLLFMIGYSPYYVPWLLD